jgi:molecular chaperone HtpG
MSGIVFEVETTRILDILSKQIYDSPLALLRENVQNAYDAVLMRCTSEGQPVEEGAIVVTIADKEITIADNGIGMTERVLRENFWRAGSTGKNTDLARRSGVVGTFGIGAMANFGVCSRLTVESRPANESTTLISAANRSDLSIAKECITLEERPRVASEGPGTTIVAELDGDNVITAAAALEYLQDYVALLPVKVSLNGATISQNNYPNVRSIELASFQSLSRRTLRLGDYEAQVETLVEKSGRAIARVDEIKLSGQSVAGDMFLIQEGGQLIALRSLFGLAPVPTAGVYELGGFANLSVLQPTAGREAVTRDSIDHVANLVALVEYEITEAISNSPASDRNPFFLRYIVSAGRIDLAGQVTVRALPEETDVPLKEVTRIGKERRTHYYVGRDRGLISMFSDDGSLLLHVSQLTPRGTVQQRYLRDIAKIEQVPDSPIVSKTYSNFDVTLEEAGIVIRVASVLSEDYLLPDPRVVFADISHGVNVLVTKSEEQVTVHLARGSAIIQPLIECWHSAFEVFPGFIKDFVRVHVFPKLADHVPTSARQGVEALRKLLQRNREVFRYEESESGQLELMLGDFLSGQVAFGDMLRAAASHSSVQTQRVTSEQVGDIESEMPDVVQSPTSAEPSPGREYEPAPAILRSISSSMKILVTGSKYRQLNEFTMFIGLSDRATRIEGDFFRIPHTTKIIWAGHRVVYIFTEASGRLTLYYDIELREPLNSRLAAGLMVATTTIITENRIYIPVPDPLVDAFRVVSGPKEFFVRFDTIVSPLQSDTSS